MQDLELWFTKAGLPIKVEKQPLGSIGSAINNNDIFQMTIEIKRKKKGKEYFRIFPGHKNNDVRVIDANSGKQQVILQVNEPEREYTVKSWDPNKRDWIYERQKTPGFLRKYLMGMDESHLFIAELPRNSGPINKIKDAHKALKPNDIIENKNDISRTKRQGEWFFIPATPDELKKINENLNLVEKKRALGGSKWRSRNLHIADILITIKDEEFAKGKISHIEHKTLKLHGWFKVLKNNEARTSSISGQAIFNGVKFVD
jgi:hypothetical protein